jgi:hypothetical protein
MEHGFVKENGKSFERFGSLNKGLDQSQRYLKVKWEIIAAFTLITPKKNEEGVIMEQETKDL